MSDIHCAKCGEPWDSYGVRHGDMTSSESQRFLKGEGCPCCNFGTMCPHCAGTGKERDEASRCYCRGEYFLIARVLDNDMTAGSVVPGRCFTERISLRLRTGEPISARYAVHYDYRPNVKSLSEAERIKAVILRDYGIKECRDGWYGEVKLACPLCDQSKAVRCHHCNGTGKFTPREGCEDKEALFRVAHELLGDDTDGRFAMLEDLS